MNFKLIKTRCFAAATMALLTYSAYAQPGPKNLCFEKETIYQIKPSSKIDSEALIIQDKLKFIPKRITRTMKQMFDEHANLVEEKQIISHQNYYSEWFTPPFKRVHDTKGVTNHYPKNREYLPNFWYKEIPHIGEYIQTSENVILHKKSHTEMGQKMMNDRNKVAQEFGLLIDFQFNQPSNQDLEYLQSMGLEIEQNGGMITAKSDQYNLTWDLENKQFLELTFDHGKLVKTIKKVYVHVKEFDEFLISSIEKTVPKEFSNGDCYDDVELVNYSNFNSDCKLDGSEKRSSFEKLVQAVTLSPNPVTDMLKVSVDQDNQITGIKVRSIEGRLMMQQNFTSGESIHNINLSTLNNGIYIIELITVNGPITKQFIKS